MKTQILITALQQWLGSVPGWVWWALAILWILHWVSKMLSVTLSIAKGWEAFGDWKESYQAKRAARKKRGKKRKRKKKRSR